MKCICAFLKVLCPTCEQDMVSGSGVRKYLDHGSGAMFLKITKEDCAAGCTVDVHLSAHLHILPCTHDEKYGTGDSKCRDCELSLSWDELIPLSMIGKLFTGGLSKGAVRNKDVDMQMWVCVRDWNWNDMAVCGAGPGRFMCFKFDERSRTFFYWGTNDELKLVSEAMIAEGLEKEDRYTKIP